MAANDQRHLVSTPFGWMLCTRDRHRHNHLPMATLPLHAIPNRRIHAQSQSNNARTNCGRKLTRKTEYIYAEGDEASHVTCNHCLNPEARKPPSHRIHRGSDEDNRNRATAAAVPQS